MLKLLISYGGNTVDYTKHLDQTTIQIQESLNIPTQMTFSLTPIAKEFVAPPQRAYVQLFSTQYQRSLFSGYIASETSKAYLGLSQYTPNPSTIGMITLAASQLTSYLLQAAGRTVGTAYEWQNASNVLIPGSCPGLSDPVLIACGMKPDGSNRNDLPQVSATTFLTAIAQYTIPPMTPEPGQTAQDESSLGKRQLFRYDIVCTSDEYLLNLKAVPFIPAYVNRTQGDILTSLATILCPDPSNPGQSFFDTSMVASGDLVPYFAYKPDQSWCEIAKQFGDGSRYRYKARDRQLFYQPYADAPLGIDYDEIRSKDSSFDPIGLQTTVLSVPVVNDVTMIGDAEAGNNHEDYFIGDGFTGNFPLRHKVFRGSTSLLLQDAWSENQLNTQQWFNQDPGNNFTLAGALNILTGPSGVGGAFGSLGQSYLQYTNAIELAGGVDLQGGEFTFENVCEGVLNGIYTDETFTEDSLLGGFVVTSPSGVVESGFIVVASGAGGVEVQTTAGGIVMQPTWAGQPVGPPVVSKIDCTYVLQIVITAPAYARYNTMYRTLDGEEYGGLTSIPVSGSVTFNIQEYNIAAATGFYYQPIVHRSTVNQVAMPPFALYALANNLRLNLTVVNTTLAVMPLGALTAPLGPCGLWWPSGLILPLLPPGSGDFIGAVQPWPSAASASHNTFGTGILPGPLPLAATATNLVLGNGYDVLVAAQISQGNNADTLAFYAQTLPIAGTPIRFQSWEQQAAVSRLQDAASITREAFIVGDNGIRSAIVSNLNPLPRTSEDCDNAALAFLSDKVGVQYNGTYTITSLNFQGLTSDIQFYPTVGRFLHVNSPRRSIYDKQFLVTTVTTTILDLQSELLKFQLGFGADLFLEKVLANFVDLKPVSVLIPQDTANPPNPRFTQDVSSSFLPDLNNVQITQIDDKQVTVEVFDNYSGQIEIRQQDTGWGRGFSFGYLTTVVGNKFTLSRLQFEQTWYMRPIAYNAYGQAVVSRRSKVLRVYWPLRPAQPEFVSSTPIQAIGASGKTVSTVAVQLDYNGDIRNIYGLEVRAADNETILVQKPIGSFSDLYVDLSLTPFLFLSAALSGNYSLYAYFFNQQWIYSEALNLDSSLAQVARPPFIWEPGFEVPVSGDSVYTTDGFGILPASGVGGIAFMDIIGYPPVSKLSTQLGPPIIIAAGSGSGGDIPAGTYVIGVDGYDAPLSANPSLTLLSNLDTAAVPDGGSISLTIEWPLGSYGGQLYAGLDANDLHHQAELAPGQLTAVLRTIDVDDYGPPDDIFDHFLILYRGERHGGVFAEQITGVTPNSVLYEGAVFTPNQFAGCVLTLLAHVDPRRRLEIANLKIASNSSNEIVIGPNGSGVQYPDLTQLLDVGDVLMVRFRPQNITASGFSDPNLINYYAPSGFDVGAETGYLAWIIDGPGAGQVRPIASNSNTGVVLAMPWSTKPTADSLIIIVAPDYAEPVMTQEFDLQNDLAGPITVASVNVTSLQKKTVVVQVVTVDVNGNYANPVLAPLREVYIFPVSANPTVQIAYGG